MSRNIKQTTSENPCKMPLFNGYECKLSLNPEAIDKEVYQIRFTGEIFIDYEYISADGREYLAKLDFYRQPVWTCSWSLKKHLTYEQALLSESSKRSYIESLGVDLKQKLTELILAKKAVMKEPSAKMTMDELATEILSKLGDDFYRDEIVECHNGNEMLLHSEM